MKFKLQSIEDWIGINYRSLESFALLIPLILLFLFCDPVYHYFFDEPVTELSFNEDQKEKQWIKSNFDPNELMLKDWVNRGVHPKTAYSIVKYRLKGGRFYEVEDLKKIYTLTSSEYERIAPYVIIKKVKSKKIKQPTYNRTFTRNKITPSNLKHSFTPHLFNPNTVQLDTLLSMGFSSKVAKSMISYREKGGQYLIKSDVLKLYGVDSSSFLEWKDFIELPDQKEILEKEKIIQKFNLNKVTKAELITLNGIGEFTANQLIKYRNRLGGSFYTHQQLTEVFGIDSLKVKILDDFCYIKKTEVILLNINTCSYEQLATHPYLSYKQARWIINYRKQHGDYHDINDLYKIKPLHPEDLVKISPYLTY
ncbi:helix-hairpin-helix domain-containing protein [Flammeovirga pacifica]|uniref:Competence protein ComEA n=1 Tax=Flammeovirga pacifica TaxID=915059 RepID=A0A1S1Z3C2_FLAPC|nr:helix-hairpin-helix domain-containing protein [Flammeovirga pacifica]OHX67786.1 hypothetical protein NH26_16285 [Flammeovirga pacifica]